MLEALRRRMAAYRLESDIRAGRRTWGRQSADPANDQHDPDAPGGHVAVKVPVKATISAIVIRADGTIEDQGILSTSDTEVDADILEQLRREAGGTEP